MLANLRAVLLGDEVSMEKRPRNKSPWHNNYLSSPKQRLIYVGLVFKIAIDF